MDPSQLSIGVAFIAGLASFLSPCVLPLVPVYLIQLVGESVYQSTTRADREGMAARVSTFLHAVVFVVGFTLTFVALGATASTLGSFLRAHQLVLREVGGILLIIIGLHLMGILKIPFLYWQKRIDFQPSRPGYPASLLMGIVFAIGWTPCVSYSLGLGVPFLLLGLGVDRFSKLLKWLKPHLGKIEIGTGVVMILAGLIIFFNLLPYMNQYFSFGWNL
jgi:cytochrome c-type biogenesis protein